jgi:hypothetical protein
MLEPRQPNLYVIRIQYLMPPSQEEQRRVWAFTAEDAYFQVNKTLGVGRDRYGFVVYVGPWNPNCSCLDKERACRCGLPSV